MKHDWTVEDHEEYRKSILRKAQKKRRENARKSGMCIMCCIRPARNGMRTCDECSERTAKRNMRVYYQNIDKGICVTCGKNTAVIGKRKCKDCLAKANEYMHKRKETMKNG